LKGRKFAGDQPSYGRVIRVPHPIDVHIGKRIRIGRRLLDMSLATFAKALGLTFQQIQKYEAGANRVSASRLSAVADILDMPISFFFYYLKPGTTEETASRERLERTETIELVRRYYAFPDQRVREQFLELVKAVAARKPAADVPLPEAPMRHRGGRRR
jgi:transcriptional regulator with XRE-family HTH domain